MKKLQKPKIGMLGIMQELYDAFMPELTGIQEEFARNVVRSLSDSVDLDFPYAVKTRQQIETLMAEFSQKGYDGIMIVNLVYGPGVNLVRALQNNHLPLLLANIQPEEKVSLSWNMDNLTYNQGIHGLQDTANTVLRTIGDRFHVVTGNWRTESFKNEVLEWARAAQTASALKRMKIAWFGKMNGMHDTIADWSAIMRILGPEIREERMGDLYRKMESLDASEIRQQIDIDRKNFMIDENMPPESHEHAVKIMLAFEKILQEGEYSGYTANFDVFAGDGRFRQLGLLAASNLMAKGYGYGAEGDVNSTILVAAGHILYQDAQFTEMYAMDFEKDSVLMSHMGEGNWKIARKDKPIRLAYRELGIGGLDNPPTPVFMAEPGEATLTSLVPMKGDHFRIVAMKGKVLDHEPYPNIEMPYFHFSPDSGCVKANNGWLMAGGTHHQCMLLGDQLKRWEVLCKILGVEFIIV
ncbi:MAG: L-fucose/L-arabinose isomerase family protein [Bacteroidales bacterium]|nr:L-fucose/L-arabinose isomerase family protein [Bacteroidales bacterium]